jgi:RsiW-degrading membrane proteinase PrsW (M82 family)
MLHFVFVRDKYEREPLGRVLLVYFLSFFAVIPAAIFEMSFMGVEKFGLIGVAIASFGIIAFSEEGSKYLALRLLVLEKRFFNEVYDGILYAVAASLGFATVENIMYVAFSGSGGLGVALLRAILSVPGHALWGVMMGYYAGVARFEPNRQRARALVWKGLLLAIFFHGLYDFFAFGSEVVPAGLAPIFMLGVFAVIAVNWVIGVKLIRLAQEQSIFKRPSPMTNPIAAVNPRWRFCHQCGKAQPSSSTQCPYCGYIFPS